MGTVYTSVDQLIGRTPLLELTGIERKLGLTARVVAKLELFNPAGSVKDRVARQMLDERPDLLSLQEIYMVAESYGKGTSGYEKAMAAAAEFYPDSPAVQGDRALAAISRGDNAEAVRLLSGSDATASNAELQNILGVALAQTGQYGEAADCLGRAADMGSEAAKHNLGELNAVIDQL